MSKSRHLTARDSDVLVRAYPARHTGGTRLSFCYEDWGQLVYPADGTISVETPEGTWVVPPLRAVWVPPGVPHQVLLHGSATLRSLYFRRNAVLSGRCATLGLTPLARELILHIAVIAPLYKNREPDRRLAGVLLDHLRQLPVLPVYLPQPKSDLMRKAAAALTQWQATAGDVANSAHISVRTLERGFKKETGLTLGTWRQQARLLEAMRLLAAGKGVGDTGYEVGYGSDSAFIYAFRRAFGVPPGAFYN